MLLGGMLLAACSQEDGAVAQLIEHQGTVDKNRGPEQSAWQPVAGKDRFRCEHGLRTGAGSWARVEHASGSRFRLKENTLIRFACHKKQQGLKVEFGESKIEAPPEGAKLLVGDAVITLEANAQGRISAQDGRMRFDLVVGTAIVKRTGDTDAELEAGQSLDLQVGNAVFKTPTTDAAIAPDAAPEGPDEPDMVTARVKGRKNQQRAPGTTHWKAMDEGEHELAPGTGLRLGKGGAADIERGLERARIEGPAEVTVGGPDGDLLEAHKGNARIEATGAEVRIRVPGGVIVARRAPGAGSKARIEVGKESTRITPESGRVDVTDTKGKTQTLELGERANLAHDGGIDARGRAPEHADVIIMAGESATLHDPRPPTAVGINFASLCPDEGVVEMSSNRRFKGRVFMSKGTGQANALLKKGAHYYRVRCLEGGVPQAEAKQSGRLHVRRDDGTRKPPGPPPETALDADGLRYTVLYQNRLPAIKFQWPGAKGKGPYELHITPEHGKAKVVDTAKPQYRMRSGTLGEGTYKFFFKAAGGARSKASTLRIAFDNAAPSAYLHAPAVKQAWSGDKVRVAGTALPGWKVTISGAAVDTDSQGRFSVEVPRPSRQRALAVKITHPRGIHYYLRRDRGK